MDNTVYRLGFAASRNQARQLVNHGHIVVNKRKVTIPSYHVKIGDIIKINEKNIKFNLFKELPQKLKKVESPAWLNLNIEDLSGKVLHQPGIKEINSNINTQMIVEYYSR